jgi:hypothetical protein
LTVQSKFEEIRKSNMVAAQRLVQSHYSSSSSDEEDEEIGTRDAKKGKILASTFTTYTVQTGNTKKSYVFWSFLQLAVHFLDHSSVTRFHFVQDAAPGLLTKISSFKH